VGTPGDKQATRATGRAVFEVVDEGSTIRYRVDINGMDDLWTAYVHVAEVPGGNGPIAFWLAPSSRQAASELGPAAGLVAGVAVGHIASDAQVVWPLASLGVGGLIEAMAQGRSYVVVHTNDLGGGEGTDPDSPGASQPLELRGAIE
jgi:hypothetical protein